MTNENLHDIALLIDSLRTSTESLKKIQVVAAALGQQRTRDELIPFVTDPQEDDDELLLVLAEQLGDLLPFVGGSPHATHLLSPLESLAASDENAVRAASVVSMQTINKGMAAADVSKDFLPLLSRLAHGCYPNRVAACALYANVHPVATPAEQQRLRAEFEALTNDDHPVVRRAAAANLARFASAAGTEHVAVFLKLFVKISQDTHESTRRVLIEHAAEFARCCKAVPGLCEELVPNVITLLHDPSWRVRYCAANSVNDLAEAFGQEVTRRDLFPHYRQLLQDKDADVRGPACQALPTICRHLDVDVVKQSVRPCLVELSKDCADRVRELLAEHLIELAPIFGRKHTRELLLEPMLTLLRDKTPAVRLNVLRKVHKLSDSIPLEQVSEALLPTLDELSADRVWRVRHQLVELTPTLSQHLGMAFFQRDVLQRTLQWLVDPASIIRGAAASAICGVAAHFGSEWTRDHVLGRVIDMATDKNYLHRTSVLYCLRDLCTAVSTGEATARIVPAFVTAASDSVPNIRFVSAKILQSLHGMLEGTEARGPVVACLQGLTEDADADVRFFAQRALSVYDDDSAMAESA